MNINVVLVGFMGAGKSSIGKILAETLGYRFEDVDVIIEQEQGCTVSDIFFYAGETFFREQEKKTLKNRRTSKSLVLSTGGGIVMERGNMELLKEIGRVYYLNAPPELIYERLKHASNRPLLNKMKNRFEEINALHKIRDPLYRQANVIVDVHTDNKKKIAHSIAKDLKKWSG